MFPSRQLPMKLHSLEISEIKKETSDSVSISFSIPDQLRKEFEYESGQYLSLESDINGEKVRRSYSLCSSPHENLWKVCVKKIENGKFSTFANNTLAKGNFIDVLPPTGNFKLKSLEKKGTYIFFAAGSGITPIISIIKHILHSTQDVNVVLFYGNRDTDSIIFREELESLKNLYMDRISLHYILSREMPSNILYSGRINAEKCEKFSKHFFDIKEVNNAFLCGPAAMIFDIEKSLINIGLDKNKIKYELFNTSELPLQQSEKNEESFDPTKESKISVHVDGLNLKFTLPYGGDSILDSALDHGADLPYSCKGGVCSTCKAKVLKGEVSMKVNYSLEEDEIQSGYVLACQSHPRSQEVELDFDV